MLNQHLKFTLKAILRDFGDRYVNMSSDYNNNLIYWKFMQLLAFSLIRGILVYCLVVARILIS